MQSVQDHFYPLFKLGITHVEVKVEDAINVTLGQAEFLSNSKNKMQLIALITVHLQQAGCKVIQAEGDADTKIIFL